MKNEKNIYIIRCRTDLGYCPIKLYCKREIVLQESASWLEKNCIAMGWHCIAIGEPWQGYWVTIHGLYCDQEVLKKRVLYCNRMDCIVTSRG